MTIRLERQLTVRRTRLRLDLVRYVPSAVLAGYGLFILSLAVRGQMTLYINPAYVGPTVLAGGVLLAIAVGRLVKPASNACGEDSCDCADGCGCESSSPRLWPYAALCIPLLLAVLFPPRALQAFSANQRGLQIAGVSTIQGAHTIKRVSLSADTRSFTLQDWVGALSADPNPRDYQGKPIVLTGLVLHNPASVPPGYLMVLRYQVTCCIADARPEGLIVRDTSHGSLRDNQWVTVTGTMGSVNYSGQAIAVVLPKSISLTKAGDPYMY